MDSFCSYVMVYDVFSPICLEVMDLSMVIYNPLIGSVAYLLETFSSIGYRVIYF